jgi:hypothetical protein
MPTHLKMKTLLSCAIATMVSLLLCSSVAAADPTPAKLQGPRLGIEDAVRIAKELVRKQDVSVADSYIYSTRLEQDRSGDRRKLWIVTWLRNDYVNDIAIKGGQTYVHIYMDGTGEVLHGE